MPAVCGEAEGSVVRFDQDGRRCAVAGRVLEDAWEDRLSVDVYLWREDRFYSQHLG